MSFNLDDYEPVAVRIDRFWEDHPNGRIKTTLEVADPELGLYRMVAKVWKDRNLHPTCDATGWAQETVKALGTMGSSILEVCETSAIGRALANLGYQTKKSGPGGPEIVRPSREEMMAAAASKAAEQRAALAAAAPRKPKDA